MPLAESGESGRKEPLRQCVRALESPHYSRFEVGIPGDEQAKHTLFHRHDRCLVRSILASTPGTIDILHPNVHLARSALTVCDFLCL